MMEIGDHPSLRTRLRRSISVAAIPKNAEPDCLSGLFPNVCVMKLDEKYKNAQPGFESEEGFIKGHGRSFECVVCGERTVWFHRDARLYFCSIECYDQYVARGKG